MLTNIMQYLNLRVFQTRGFMCGRTELRIAPLYFLNVNLVYKVKKI